MLLEHLGDPPFGLVIKLAVGNRGDDLVPSVVPGECGG